MADHFDYRTASEEQILAKASELRGRLLGTLPGARFTAATGATGRAEVGHAIEHYFGIPPNPSPLPDFPGAGIELKVLPLRRTGRGLAVKERTVISQIDYLKLMEQTWATASVRKKLRILFVFFEHLDGMPKEAFPIHDVLLWQPDARTNLLLQADWERVSQKVRQGKAHELSESDGAIMGPCTKGASGASVRRQPFGDAPAKSRAWALKPSFTWSLYVGATERRASESVLTSLAPDAARTFEQKLSGRFEPFVGQTIGQAGQILSIPASDSKSYAAAVVRRIFGVKSFRARIIEFEEMGLTPRITRVRADLMPYEATSFPAFRYLSLLEEAWDDSDLLARLEYMLFVPVLGEAKATPQTDCTIGRPVFWRPTANELELIRREWEQYRLEIELGSADRLTPAADTIAIHVRPHARNALDTDEAPGVGPIVKKSFWLNKPFVQRILRQADPFSPPQRA
jgi:DNA mismatch repair protein MutH